MSLIKRQTISPSASTRTSIFSRSKIKSVAIRSSSFLLYQKLIILLLISALVLLLAKVYFSNQLAVSGTRVSYSKSKLINLTREKFELENQLSQRLSLGYLESRAVEMGLVKISKVEVIRGPGNVALGQ